MLGKIISGLRVSLVFIALLAVFLFAMFEGGFVSWFLFYSFSPFGLYALLLLLYPLEDLQIERKVERYQYSAGDHLDMTIILKRRIPFPLFYLAINHEASFGLKGGRQLVFPWFKRKMEMKITTRNLTRGEHFLGDIVLKTGDPLGLLDKELRIPSSQKVLVFPHYVDVIYRSVESRYEQGTTSSRIKVQNDTTMVTGVRPYQPGDRFTWIDWKATARLNDIQTKEFEVLQSHDVLVILDRSSSDKFELSVMFTASLIRSILRHGGQIGLYSAGEDHSIYPVKGGEEHQYQLFLHLARVKADSPLPISSTLAGNVFFYQPSAALLIITCQLTRDFIQSLYPLVRRKRAAAVFVMKEKGEPVTAEEQELSRLAFKQKLYIKFLYEDGFRFALSEVKKND